MLSFHDAVAKFRDGTDTPRAYLERCIERIEALEPAVMAFAFLNLDRARKAADEVGRAIQGRPAARPRRRHAGRHQGPDRNLRHADRVRQRAVQGPSADGRRGLGARVAAGRRRAGRQDRHGVPRRRRSGAHPQSVRHPPHAGRLVERHRGRGGRADAAGRRSAPTGAARPSGRRASAASMRSSPPSARSTGRARSRWPTAWTISACSPARCPICGPRRAISRSEAGGDPSHPGPLRRAQRRRRRASPRGSSGSTPRAGRSPNRRPRRPSRLIVARLVDAGVEIVTRRDDPAIEAYETAHARTPQLWANLYRFEMRWPMLQYRERHRDKMPPRLLKGIEDGAHITQEIYRAALVERDQFRAMHDELARRADGFITLSSPGPGPDRHGPGQRDLQRGLVDPGRAGHQPALAGGRSGAARRPIARPLARRRAADRRRALACRGAFRQSVAGNAVLARPAN